MNYISTRNKNKVYSFEEALYEGLSSDGGLLLPENITHLTFSDLEQMHGSHYVDIAGKIIEFIEITFDSR